MSTQQRIATYIVRSDTWDVCQRDLRAAGFDVRREERVGGTLIGVLVRDETSDEDVATRIIEQHVPDVRQGPPSVPTRHRPGYRDDA